MGAVLREVAAAEGLRGLYRGLLAVTLKAVLFNSVMMAFKHMLQGSRALTPPGSPSALDTIARLPILGRQAFPVELLTADKLSEILSYIQGGKARQIERQVDRIDQRMDDIAGEVRSVKHLLTQLVNKTSSGESLQGAAA